MTTAWLSTRHPHTGLVGTPRPRPPAHLPPSQTVTYEAPCPHGHPAEWTGRCYSFETGERSVASCWCHVCAEVAVAPC